MMTTELSFVGLTSEGEELRLYYENPESKFAVHSALIDIHVHEKFAIQLGDGELRWLEKGATLTLYDDVRHDKWLVVTSTVWSGKARSYRNWMDEEKPSNP